MSLKTDFYPFHKLFRPPRQFTWPSHSHCLAVLGSVVKELGTLHFHFSWLMHIQQTEMSQKHQIVYMGSKTLCSVGAMRCLSVEVRNATMLLNRQSVLRHLLKMVCFHISCSFSSYIFLGACILSISMSITYEIYQVNSEFSGLPSTEA